MSTMDILHELKNEVIFKQISENMKLPLVYRWAKNIFFYHRSDDKQSSLNGRFIGADKIECIFKEVELFYKNQMEIEGLKDGR